MLGAFARALYESPLYVALGPFLSAWSVGFVVMGIDGKPHLTAAGRAYLTERGV